VTLDFMTAYTNRNAATSRCKRDTVLKSTGGGRRGTLLLSRTYSTHGRSYKTSGRPRGATNRRVGTGYGAGGAEALLLIELAIQDNRLIMREGAHAPLL
jgi:hypothetical protein